MKKLIESIWGKGMKGWGAFAFSLLQGLPDYKDYKKRIINAVGEKVATGRSLPEVAQDFFAYKVEVTGSLDAFPKKGPLLVISNHPTNGGLDGMALLGILQKARPDYNLFGNVTFAQDGWPVGPWYLPLVRTDKSVDLQAIRRGMRQLEAGHCLSLFPVVNENGSKVDMPRSFWTPLPAKMMLSLEKKGEIPAFLPIHMEVVSERKVLKALLKGAAHFLGAKIGKKTFEELNAVLVPKAFRVDIGEAYRLEAGRIVNSGAGNFSFPLPSGKAERTEALLDFMKKHVYRRPQANR